MQSTFLGTTCKVTDSLYRKYLLMKIKDVVKKEQESNEDGTNRLAAGSPFGWRHSQTTTNKMRQQS